MLTLELLFNLIVAYVNRKGSKFKFVDNVVWLFIASNLLAFPMYLSMYFVIKADDSHHDNGKCDCDFIDGWITI
jgi:heme/copper-type cytochrome/quinol oxidase subunit 3